LTGPDRPEALNVGAPALRRNLEKEIMRLHAFFSDWYSGVDGREIAEFEHSFDEAFYIVSAHGSVSGRSSEAVKEHRGSIPLEIEIRGVTLRQVVRGVSVATYEEHQVRNAEHRALISTVGLVRDDMSPGGFRWLFAHETKL